MKNEKGKGSRKEKEKKKEKQENWKGGKKMREKNKRKQARVSTMMRVASSNCRFRLVFHNANGRTDGWPDGQTNPLIEMRGRI